VNTLTTSYVRCELNGFSTSSNLTIESKSLTSLGYVQFRKHLILRICTDSGEIGVQQLSIPDEQVEEIVVALILDEKIQGRIDQVTGRLELDRQCVASLSTAEILSKLIG